MTQPTSDSRQPDPNEPAFAGLATLARWMREGKTTPTRLAEYFLARLEQHGQKFNAVVTITRERALREAQRAEAELKGGNDKGLLHGIPYGVKDLLATREDPTTWGAGPLADQRFAADATVVERLSAAGGVLVAKLAMVELAGGMGYRQADASFTGPGLNPWNPTAWSGGSSTGPGAAVAAGLVPYAIGSETWGSILTPASFCGVCGVRPTYGRVSRHGAMALSWTMDKLGPMTRSAEDAALVLAAIAGPDPLDPTTLPQPFRGMAPPLQRKLRLAVVADADRRLQPEVSANYQRSLELLKGMGEIATVELPALPFNAAADVILSAELGSALEEIIGTEKAAQLQAPEDRIGGIADQFIFAKDYIRALRIRAKAIAVLDEWLRPFDALIAPATAAVACPIDRPFNEYFRQFGGPNIGGAGNLAGLPCVILANGFGERGLPTGLQLLGRALSEPLLLRLAHDLQERTIWHLQYPKIV